MMLNIMILINMTILNTEYDESRDSSVGIVLGYGLDDRGSKVRFPARAGNFSLHHRVQTGSGAHPVSYPMGTGALSLGVKRPGREADHSPPSSAGGQRMSGAIPPLPNTPSWRCAQLKHRENFILSYRSVDRNPVCSRKHQAATSLHIDSTLKCSQHQILVTFY
jgi:hypothetical protein